MDTNLKSALRMTGVIASFGALAGFVSGIVEPTACKIALPAIGDGQSTVVELGFLGDIFIGALTSAAAYYFFGSFLGFADAKFDNRQDWAKLISLSILTGFMGIGLMNKLTSQLDKRFEEVGEQFKAVDKAVGDVESTVQKVNTSVTTVAQDVENVRKTKDISDLVQDAISKIDKARDEMELSAVKGTAEATRLANLAVAEKFFRQALFRLERALEIDSKSASTLIEKARVLKGLSQIYEYRKEASNRDKMIEDAIGVLSNVLEAEPSNARALYNRACYNALYVDDKSLADYQRSERVGKVVKDIKAIKELGGDAWLYYKEYLENDSDLEKVRNMSAFRECLE